MGQATDAARRNRSARRRNSRLTLGLPARAGTFGRRDFRRTSGLPTQGNRKTFKLELTTPWGAKI